LAKAQTEALALLDSTSPAEPGPLVQYVLWDSLAAVLCPACKLWNTGHGANMMREAVSLMGGYGLTEDCPGFLGQKWMDAQLEATYEGPEAVQRLQLSMTMTNPLFLAQFAQWISEMKRIASDRPGTGACALGTAMKLWLWTLQYLQTATDADGAKLYLKMRQGVTFPLADALCWLLAARQFILDVIELETQGAENPALAGGLAGTVAFFTDLCHVQAARAAGEVGRVSAEILHGYNRHPAWDEASCRACYGAEELTALEGVIPGLDASARAYSDVAEPGQAHPPKAGPCVKCEGLEPFVALRAKLDTCLTGCRLAKDRAAESLTKVMTREALDYPV
jgi:alkylation response protein AidB-like acyl-CoA dehydrogenase